jgi:hypothetical protein
VSFVDEARIAFGLGHFGEIEIVAQLALEGEDAVDPAFELVALAHELLGLFRIVPEIGALGERGQFIESDLSAIPVKDASATGRRRSESVRRERRYRRAWAGPGKWQLGIRERAAKLQGR